MSKRPQNNRLKNFYIIFSPVSMHRNQYCKVEASLQADVEMYADHYFQDEWLKILSSGQWWEYRKRNMHLVGIEAKEAEKV